MRIERLLRQNAVRRGEQLAVIDDHGQLTWAELDRQSNQLARALIDRGYRQQERVALVMANDQRLVVAYYGLWKANLVAVGINPRLTKSEMARILAHSGAAAVICDSPVASEAGLASSSVREVLVVGIDIPTLVSSIECEGSSGTKEICLFDGLIASGSPDPVPEMGSGSDLRALRYTSGTTGAPKGCMATHDQQVASTANYLCEVDVPRDGPTWISVPLSLGVGASFVTTTAYLGVPLLLRRRFDVAGFLKDVDSFGVRHTFLVPTMLVDLHAALADLDPVTMSNLSLIGYGGAPVSWSLIKSLAEILSVDFYHAFGATEAGGFTALLAPDDHRKLLREDVDSIAPVGRPAAFADVEIVSDEGHEVAVSEVGEMRIRATSVFSGYWCQPEQTRAVLEDGWLRLGDMAWRDKDGYIYLADRALGVIRSGAQNVYAGEIEAVLQGCPGVHRAAVIGTSDSRFGEAVKALVQRASGSELTEQDIHSYCAQRLAKYKRPRDVEFVTELPIDEGGKIKRAELKRMSGMIMLGGETKET